MKDRIIDEGEEIESLRLSLAICGIVVNSQAACIINETFKKMKQLGEKFSVSDAMQIHRDVDKRYNMKKIVATPDTLSE